jgi:phosphate transport system permease protein
VGAALYLEEFAPRNRWTRLLEANINNLAGVPSIVYGLLGLSVFVFFLGFGRSLITGALTLTALVLPVVIVASREALRAVPREIRDGGLALGGTPLQVAARQTLPAAIPAIMTGMILSLSRAIGETAPILVAGAVFSRRADNEPWNLNEAYTAIPIQIFDFVKRPQAEFQVEVASAAILVLMVLLLIMNSAAIIIRNRYSRNG